MKKRNNFLVKSYFTSIMLLFSQAYTYGQDSMKIVNTIDSIWSVEIRAKKKVFGSRSDSIKYQVWYSKNTNDIITIAEIHYPISTEETKYLSYNYHFRDNKLIFITKYNNASIKDQRRKVCYYYFRREELLYKHEFKFTIQDIENEKLKAYRLKMKFSKS
ncbi:MAG TPA: hypothetical protein PLF17_14740 [Chitinophagaceae bacterium]|nr:hypothetical protein [Chitinophagaceae bacterium]